MRQKRDEGPHSVDIHVGSRLQQRRTALGISQQELASSQGVTFQQVQKYERAANRISASRLYRLSEVLDVPVTYFFEGIAGTSTIAAPPASSEFTDPLDTPETAELIAAYQAISDPLMRQRLLDLARSLGSNESAAHARRSRARHPSKRMRSHRARDR
jgi:transcriptional regulator with XRE-family HTH domain